MPLVFWELEIASSILGKGKKIPNLSIAPDLLEIASELLLKLGKNE